MVVVVDNLTSQPKPKTQFEIDFVDASTIGNPIWVADSGTAIDFMARQHGFFLYPCCYLILAECISVFPRPHWSPQYTLLSACISFYIHYPFSSPLWLVLLVISSLYHVKVTKLLWSCRGSSHDWTPWTRCGGHWGEWRRTVAVQQAVWGFPEMRVPQEWLVYRETPIKMDDLGVSLF